MAHVDLKGLAKQALTSKEIMANVKNAVSKAGQNLSDKALFNFQDNGTVQVDADGDGVYDFNITGLVVEGGTINTKAENLRVSKEQFNTFDYESQETLVKEHKALVQEYLADDGTLDDAKIKQKLDAKYKDQIAALKQDPEIQAAEKRLQEMKNDPNVADYTADELAARKEEMTRLQKKLGPLTTLYKQKAADEAEIRGNFSKYQEAQGKFNTYLLEAGYTTAESRRALKTKGADGKRGAGQAEGEKVTADKTVQDLVLEQAKAKVENLIKRGVLTKEQVGDNAEIVIDDKTGKVLVKFKGAGDQDNIEDFELTGIYDKKKGTIEFDTDKYGSGESERSSAKIAKLKADYNLKMAQITEGIQSGMSNKQLNKLNGELAEIKAQLQAWDVSTDNFKANKVE